MKDETQLARIGREIQAWERLRDRFANTLPGTGFLILDAAERVIERVDRPRVVGVPTLQYQPPDVERQNWSLFDRDIAYAGAAELDRVQVTFAPHSVSHIRDFIEGRLGASREKERLLNAEYVVQLQLDQHANAAGATDGEEDPDVTPGVRF
ncbi:hypothetical protein [Stenotrophomonas maltophilia]|uniref:hypothetical protein n=1 Tax=Stenotrophomonas maltophilia TaxID=40324 RepID=UPI000B4D2084|nr:hypothetical protein [Stenotrophomonas maltophilia]OWQ61308.1 hypothetical protein CEE58_15880 [Stenotrophomonas maltophilia]